MSGVTGPGISGGTTDPWAAMSTLVAGPVAWGAIGYGLDAVTGDTVFVPIGLVIGFIGSLWFIWFQHTHARPAASPARPTPTSDAQGDLP